jgi:hypothetical protein
VVEDVAAQEVGYLLDEALRKCQDQVIFQFSPPHKRRIEARPLAASYCLLWTKSWGVQYYIPLKDPAWVGYPVIPYFRGSDVHGAGAASNLLLKTKNFC